MHKKIFAVFICVLAMLILAMSLLLKECRGMQLPNMTGGSTSGQTKPSITAGTESTQPEQETEPSQGTEPTEPEQETEPTQGTEPTEPEQETEPSQGTESTEPEQETEPSQGTEPTEPDKELTDLTYAQYISLSAKDQQAYYEAFQSDEAFFAWYRAAKAEFEEQKDAGTVSGGKVDISDYIGN